MNRKLMALMAVFAATAGVLAYAAAAEAADAPAGESVYQVGSDGITLYEPIHNTESYNYIISGADGVVFLCGGGTQFNGDPCESTQVVPLTPGDYKLNLVLDLGLTVDQDSFTVGEEPTPTPTPTPPHNGHGQGHGNGNGNGHGHKVLKPKVIADGGDEYGTRVPHAGVDGGVVTLPIALMGGGGLMALASAGWGGWALLRRR